VTRLAHRTRDQLRRAPLQAGRAGPELSPSNVPIVAGFVHTVPGRQVIPGHPIRHDRNPASSARSQPQSGPPPQELSATDTFRLATGPLPVARGTLKL